MTNKILSIIIVLSMLCTFFVGCSATDNQDVSSADATSSTADTSVIADESESSDTEAQTSTESAESETSVNSSETESYETESSEESESSEDVESSEEPESSESFDETASSEASTEDSSTEMSAESSEEATEPESSEVSEASSVEDSSEPESSLPEENEPEQSEVEESSKPEEHTCDFKKDATTEPTCENAGYTLYKCQCGKTQKVNEVPALGHTEGEWKVVTEATATNTGLKQKICTRCNEVLDEAVIPKVEEPKSPLDIYPEKYQVHPKGNQKLVEEAIEYYLNIYRELDGVSATTRLPNKTYEYATRRAVQLSTNFGHDRNDIIEICNDIKFGKYNPPTERIDVNWETGEWTPTGEIVPEYYYGGFSEACAGPVTNNQTVDNVARTVAYAAYTSQNHWRYVGAETTKYITVGAFDQYDNGGKWYVCITTGDVNSKKYDAWDYDDKLYYEE